MRARSAVLGLVLTATATVGMGLVGAPAQAANLDGNCDGNEICVFRNNGNQNTGGMRDMTGDNGNYDGDLYVVGCTPIPRNCSTNDTVSSIRNTTRFGALFFVNLDGGGNALHVAGKDQRSNLSQDAFPGGGSWNDRISSHCIQDTSQPSWCG